jgi:hypothetical protein
VIPNLSARKLAGEQNSRWDKSNDSGNLLFAIKYGKTSSSPDMPEVLEPITMAIRLLLTLLERE